MNKIINLFSLIFFVLFFFNVLKFYSSENNIKNINLNRLNIDEILDDKISNIPTIKSDTNNVIEFNSSLSEKINNDKVRNFWDLLKSK